MTMETGLTPEERERYDRQLILPQVGEAGQLRLRRSRVALVGAGGLGSSAALYLTAAGVGTLGIIDSDRVDATNLQRQILHGTGDKGREKVRSAGESIHRLNPHVAVEALPVRLDDDNAREILAGFDIVLGCVDNFVTRYTVNAACAALGKPNVFGSAAIWEGQASVFCLDGGPCYRCFFRDPPPADWRPARPDQAVLGTVPGVIGCIQATETIKVLLGIGRNLSGRLLLYDALNMAFREIPLRKDPDCPVCGMRSGVL